MRIYLQEPENFRQADLRSLESVGEVRALDPINDEEKDIIEFSPDVLFTRLGFFTGRSLLEKLESLRFVVTCTTGLNHIDVAACHERGIGVLSLQGETEFLGNITSTAEHTWFLLLALFRRAPRAWREVLSGGWSRKGYYCSETTGKTLGIIGYGRLGSMLVPMAKAFRMNVLVHDCDKGKMQRAGELATDLDTLLACSDAICLMINYSERNAGFMDARAFQSMKQGSIFVNTSRGELVDEFALLDALRSGKLAGAALDVVDGDSGWQDRWPESHPVCEYAIEHDNLIITPHIGGHAIEAIQRTRSFMIQKLLQALAFSESSQKVEE